VRDLDSAHVRWILMCVFEFSVSVPAVAYFLCDLVNDKS